MRTLMALAICFSLVFYISVSLSESDEICCTWFNLKHIEGKFPQKIVFHYDGTYATYEELNSIDALSRGMFQIVKKWTDSEGDIWYKIIMQDPKRGNRYKLAKVSKEGRKLEFVCKSDKYPTKIDGNESDYCNYMRASMDYQSLP